MPLPGGVEAIKGGYQTSWPPKVFLAHPVRDEPISFFVNNHILEVVNYDIARALRAVQADSG